MPIFPAFHLQRSSVLEATAVVGSVTRTTHGRENWVGDGWFGFLKAGDQLIPGRWHRREDSWAFAPDNVGDLDAIRARPEWEVLDGYWGERAEIVLDQARQWHKAAFQPTNAIRFEGPAGTWVREASDSDTTGGEIIKAGWDHEHCAICWETLGPGGQSYGYVSAQGARRTWVCEQCYVHFVQRGSLDFIPSP